MIDLIINSQNNLHEGQFFKRCDAAIQVHW